VHISALTEQRLTSLRAGQTSVDAGASADEVALASKGFTEQVEREWRQQHGDSGYPWVDRMEAFVVPPDQSVAFLDEGAVTPREGGGI
jgi:hypothetical protein